MSSRSRCSLLTAAAAAGMFAFPLAAQSGGQPPVYPKAVKGGIADDYHGVKVPDPYRALEDADSPESRKWIEAQNDLVEKYLGAVPQREAIKARMTELWNFERWGTPFKEGGKYFVTRNDGLQNQAPLYVLDSLEAKPRLLLDPNTLKADGTMALAGMAVSDDGKFLAYGLAEAGSDWNTWQVRNVETGKDTADVIRWVKFSGASWLKDGSGFFYSRYDAPKEGESLKAVNYYPKFYFHKLGTDQSADVLVYDRQDQKEWGIGGAVTDDGRYIVLTLSQGTDPKNRVFVRDLKAAPIGGAAAATDAAILDAETGVRAAVDALEAAKAAKASDNDLAAAKAKVDAAHKVRAGAIAAAKNTSRGFVEILNDFDASYDFIDNDGPVFWFKTDREAPRSRIIAININHPERENWKEIVPQQSETLLGASTVGGLFHAMYLKDAKTLVRVYDLAGKHVRDVDLPGIGTAGGFGGKRSDTETFYSFAGFTTPGTIYRYDPSTGKSGSFRKPSVKFNPDDYETTQVFYQSKDGTKVPMFITAKKGIKKDGNNPTLLYGYGGFNIPLTPGFSPANLVWMEMGGVYAVANLRGGGEYGEEWHQAGTKTRKQNVFNDFIAAADYLIKEKYTSTPKLAIHGGSNGGLLVGACMVQRPDLFGAAIPAVGVLDMMRFHKFTIGWAWCSDYGNAEKDEAEFKAMLAYSPYHNVKQGACYPPTLITTGDHDDRVFPGHSFKFAAALQEAQACANPILIRIDTRAGHGAGKPTAKIIEERADMWAFLVRALNMNPSIAAAAPAGGK